MFETLVLVLCAFYTILIGLFVWGLWQNAPQTNESQPLASVIIPAKNEANNITNCLNALAIQTYPHNKVEIILVNDRSTDQTVACAQRLGLQNLKIITITEQIYDCPKKNAIHHGFLACKGEIIFTTDADCRPEPEWLSDKIKCFTPTVGLVMGYAPLIAPKGILNTLLSLQSLVVGMLSASGAGIGLPITCTGRNLAYRREAFDEVNGYEGVGHIIGGDDIYIMQKITKTRFKIVFHDSPNARVPSNVHQDHQFNRQLRYQSKSFHYGPTVLLPALAVYIFHFILFGIPAWVWFCPALFQPLLVCLCVKTFADATYFLATTKRFGQWNNLKWFPLIETILYPYIVIVCALGALMPKKWK